MTTELRRCRSCGEEKPLADYGRASKYKDGLNIRCKPCAQILRRDYKKKRLDSMTIEELEVHEEKTRRHKREYRRRNRDKNRQYRARARLRTNIPKWQSELDGLKELLAMAGGSARTHPEVELELITAHGKLRWFSNKLSAQGKSTFPKDVLVARVADLEAKLEAAPQEDIDAAYNNINNPHNWHGNLPLSLRRQLSQWQAKWEEVRREVRSKMTAEERAAERAEWDAFYQATNRELDDAEMLDARTQARLHRRIEQKLKDYRGGGARWHQVEQAQRDADASDSEQYDRDSQLIAAKYDELYPQYLEEERAKDRADMAASNLLSIEIGLE